MALLCGGSENTLIPAFPIMQISSNLVMNHIFQLFKVIPHRDTNVFTGWAALGYTSKLHSCAKPVEKLSFLISNILFFSSYGALFILVKAPCGLPSAALLTTTTCSRSRDSFDILFPLLMEVKKLRKHTEEMGHELFRGIQFNSVFARKKARTNSWIWNQSNAGSVHRSNVQALVTIWSWLKFSVSVDVSELWGIPSRQLTAGVLVIQYLQGMRKWERCNRRHHTRCFQLFLTAFMKIEAQRGVQYEQQNYKKTRSEKRTPKLK